MPDVKAKDTTTMTLQPGTVHEISEGLTVAHGLYGATGTIIMLSLVWAIVYTWRVWPERLKEKRKEETGKNKSPPSSSNIDESFAKINKRLTDVETELAAVRKIAETNEAAHAGCQSTIVPALQSVNNGVLQLKTTVGEFKAHIHSEVKNLEDRVWDLKGGG